MRTRPVISAKQTQQQSQREQEQLRTIYRGLTKRSSSTSRVSLVVDDDGKRTEIAVPSSLERLIAEIAETLSQGDGVALIPLSDSLTTSQAADLLGVSRQYLQRLLDKGVIPFHMVGAHHRLKIQDVLAYQQQREKTRKQALTEIIQLGEELQDSE
ncbi:MAG TPA: helix-turn-helix domain-containing protein [Chloroflexota bacterium]|nr:helix-turn-helix domain-containing protein [Chloroflexota bacterium]